MHCTVCWFSFPRDKGSPFQGINTRHIDGKKVWNDNCQETHSIAKESKRRRKFLFRVLYIHCETVLCFRWNVLAPTNFVVSASAPASYLNWWLLVFPWNTVAWQVPLKWNIWYYIVVLYHVLTLWRGISSSRFFASILLFEMYSSLRRREPRNSSPAE